MRSICVFCGSKAGEDSHFKALAEATGRTLARSQVRMVYGGAKIGLMGVAARAALAEGGEVTGIIPEFLIDVEGVQDGADIRITATMASRKALMVDEADAFLVLPGGFGTLEEVFDMIMLRQLDRHAKPAFFVDTNYWAPMKQLVHHIVDTGFGNADVVASLGFHDTPEEAIAGLLSVLDDTA